MSDKIAPAVTQDLEAVAMGSTQDLEADVVATTGLGAPSPTALLVSVEGAGRAAAPDGGVPLVGLGKSPRIKRSLPRSLLVLLSTGTGTEAGRRGDCLCLGFRCGGAGT